MLDVTIEHDVSAAMRDGVVLRADVYRPATGGPWPVLLTRLPYVSFSKCVRRRLVGTWPLGAGTP